MTDKESKHTLKCAWKSFEGTFCPEAERLFKAQKEENKKLKQALIEMRQHFNEECEQCRANYVNITDEICEVCKNNEILQIISEVLDK